MQQPLRSILGRAELDLQGPFDGQGMSQEEASLILHPKVGKTLYL